MSRDGHDKRGAKKTLKSNSLNKVLTGNTLADGRGLRPLVDRMCAGPTDIGKDGEDARNVAFAFQTPQLNEELYQVHARIPPLAMAIEDVWTDSCGRVSTMRWPLAKRTGGEQTLAFHSPVDGLSILGDWMTGSETTVIREEKDRRRNTLVVDMRGPCQEDTGLLARRRLLALPSVSSRSRHQRATADATRLWHDLYLFYLRTRIADIRALLMEGVWSACPPLGDVETRFAPEAAFVCCKPEVSSRE